jgi:probable addiction module antidote protein
MAGHRPFSELTKKFSPERKARVAAKSRAFKVTDHLDNPKVIAAYLSEAFESGDPRLVKLALGAVARRYGMSKVADNTGRSRTSLYRALAASGNPGLDTVMRALNAMGVRLEARAKPSSRKRSEVRVHV